MALPGYDLEQICSSLIVLAKEAGAIIVSGQRSLGNDTAVSKKNSESKL